MRDVIFPQFTSLWETFLLRIRAGKISSITSEIHHRYSRDSDLFASRTLHEWDEVFEEVPRWISFINLCTQLIFVLNLSMGDSSPDKKLSNVVHQLDNDKWHSAKVRSWFLVGVTFLKFGYHKKKYENVKCQKNKHSLISNLCNWKLTQFLEKMYSWLYTAVYNRWRSLNANWYSNSLKYFKVLTLMATSVVGAQKQCLFPGKGVYIFHNFSK